MKPSERISKRARELLAEAVRVPLDGKLLEVRENPMAASEIRDFPGGRLVLTQLEPADSTHEALTTLARTLSMLPLYQPRLLIFVTRGQQVVHPEVIYRLTRGSYHFQLYAYSLGEELVFEEPLNRAPPVPPSE